MGDQNTNAEKGSIHSLAESAFSTAASLSAENQNVEMQQSIECLNQTMVSASGENVVHLEKEDENMNEYNMPPPDEGQDDMFPPPEKEDENQNTIDAMQEQRVEIVVNVGQPAQNGNNMYVLEERQEDALLRDSDLDDEEEEESDKRCSPRKCCKSTFSKKRVKQLFPITSWLPRYKLNYLRFDIIAGLTVALTVIPQGLAYAAVAGLELQYGLYSAFMGCFVYCIFGTSKDITLGPTAIMSILVAEYARDPWKDDTGDETSNVTLAILLTFMCGITQLLMSVLRLGFLVHYISHPVITGFTSAAAVVIAAGQIKKILGIKASREFFHMIMDIIHHIGDTKVWDVVMGVSCMIILFILKNAKERWGNVDKNKGDDVPLAKRFAVKTLWFLGTARNAVVVIIASGIAFAVTDMSAPVNERPLTLTPNISGGLPPPSVPSFTEPIPGTNQTASFGELMSMLGSGLAVIPLMGLLESIAIAQAFARKNNYRVRPTQELLAIGMSNLAGSFVGSYPVTGSFSRTAVNSQSNVMTPLGGVVTGALVLVALETMSTAFQYIPSSGLAAVIIMAVINMFDFQTMKIVWRVNRIDIIPLAATFFVCFWDLAYGIICGIGISLVILLASHASPKIKEQESGKTLIMKVQSGLFFPAAEYFENYVQTHTAKHNCACVILDCTSITALDFSAVEAFYHCADNFEKTGITLKICGLKPSLADKLRRRKIAVGDAQMFQDVSQALGEPATSGAEAATEYTDLEVSKC